VQRWEGGQGEMVPEKPIVNCVILTSWPTRKKMLQEAICGFLAQDYENKFITVVNDGQACVFNDKFPQKMGGILVSN